MQNLFDAGGFLVCFPLYLLQHRSGVYQFLISTPTDGDIATPIFTDEDAARTFLEKGPAADEYRLRSIAEPLALLGLLTVLEHDSGAACPTLSAGQILMRLPKLNADKDGGVSRADVPD